ncbi:MAG TPA: permease-like cell division protein FtsX [Candidatus Saccharimonadales bacterium]|nr:permease-like cell division protein FtsX [Candidatus Saccharimonadales bacterium]
MKALITLWRVIKSGTQNVLRNATLAVAAIAVMTITLTTVLFLYIVNITFDNTIHQINAKIDISIYLNDQVTDTQTNNLIVQLKHTGEVQSVQYISKSQALALYIQQNSGNSQLQSAIAETNNPLPATVIVKPINPSDLGQIKNLLNEPQILVLQSDPSSYSGSLKTAIDRIAKTTTVFREIGIIGTVVFAVVSMLIIFNTIRIAIFNRRDELTIMRLLGASNWFIRGPYIVESTLYGIISALVSMLIVNSIFYTVSNSFQANSLGLLNLGYATSYFRRNLIWILLIQLGLGILIGAVSSLIATRRYLKFKTRK